MEWVWEVCAEDVDLGVMLQVISSQREHSSSIRALHALSRTTLGPTLRALQNLLQGAMPEKWRPIFHLFFRPHSRARLKLCF